MVHKPRRVLVPALGKQAPYDIATYPLCCRYSTALWRGGQSFVSARPSFIQPLRHNCILASYRHSSTLRQC